LEGGAGACVFVGPGGGGGEGGNADDPGVRLCTDRPSHVEAAWKEGQVRVFRFRGSTKYPGLSPGQTGFAQSVTQHSTS
jgi:hypothetical protein